MAGSKTARYFWAAVVGFLGGVLLRSLCPIGAASIGFTVLLGCVTALLSLGRNRSGFLTALALVCFSAGAIRMQAAIEPPDPILAAQIGRSATIQGVVSAEPDVRDTQVRVTLAAQALLSPDHQSVRAGVLVILPAHSGVAYGDTIRAWGSMRAPEPFDTSAGRQFPYPQYLAAQGVQFELERAGFEEVQGAPRRGNLAAAFAIAVKEWYIRGLERVLPEPEAGLAAGITAGDKRSIGSELSATFQRVGLVHIVVLSGYNITVVVNAVEKLLARAFAESSILRLGRLGAGALVVSFFILMSGGAASAVRAGIMALVASLARVTNRLFLASRALGIASALIVAWNPYELVFDPSFQLSALASVGLIWFTPLIEERLQWLTARFGVREIVSSTIATQAAVGPLLLYQNGLLSVFALPANVLTLSLMPVSMFLSFVAGVAGAIAGPLAIPLALPSYLLLSYVIGVADVFASMPFASMSIGVFGPGVLVGVYACMGVGTWVAYHVRLQRQSRAASPGFVSAVRG